jgi:hypothetical protein
MLAMVIEAIIATKGTMVTLVTEVSRRRKEEQALKGKYLEEYMALNTKMENGRLGRTENWKG